MRSRRTTIQRALVTAVALAVAAAACGDDGTDSTVADPTTTTTTGPTTTSEADGGGGDGGETSTTTTEAIVLGDSSRGVTADAITVGVVAVDLEALRGLVDLDHGSYEDAYRAIIEDVNDNGGVLGRRIDMIFESFVPIGDEETDAICTRLTEDEEVFAVIGGLLDDGPLCYTEINDTAFIGSTQNDQRVARSTAPWFTGARNSDETLRVILDAFVDRGELEGKVALVAEIAAQTQVETVALPLLDDLGVDVVDIDYIEASLIDEFATEAEVGLMAERHRTLEADTILTIAGAGPRYAGGIEDGAFRPRIVTTSLSSMRGYIRDRDARDLSVLEGSVAGNTAEQLGWWADPALQECIGVVEAATGTTILDPNTRAPEEPENIVSVAAACRNIRLFAAIAEAAGGELTNDSFATAGASLGEFHIPGYGTGIYDADNPDGDAPIYFYEWDDELQDLRTDGTVLG